MVGVVINGGLSLRAASCKVVLEEGLDISSLPDTLKEDFNLLDRLEGEYRVTSFLPEAVGLEDLSARIGPPCNFCNLKEKSEERKTVVEQFKPTITMSKVKLGSPLYKEGSGWIETSGRAVLNCMILGHKNYIKNAQADNMNLLSMKEFIVPGSNIFRISYMDGVKLRKDTSFSWRRAGEKVVRQGLNRLMWKLDTEGNLRSTHEGLFYCAG